MPWGVLTAQSLMSDSRTAVFRLLAMPVLFAAAWGVAAYPFARPELALGLLVYAVVAYWRPVVMLFAVPVWLAAINLAPWSGSLYLEDYDLFLGATLSVCLARGLYDPRLRLTPLQTAAVALLALATVTGFARGFFPVPEWSYIERSSYFSHWNALRQAKGFFWALLLLPALAALLRTRKDEAVTGLVWGLAAAGAVVGLAAMWERQVFLAVAEGGGRYQILGSLLDFTTPYRITALFSEMHTGGEAIDGFVALVWPFGLLALMRARSRAGIVLAALALLLVLYAAVTTFSRASYLALAVGLVAGILLLAGARRRVAADARAPVLVWIALLLPVALGGIHLRGGLVSLSAMLLAWGGAMLVGYRLLPHHRTAGIALLLALGLAGGYGIAHGMLTSRWVSNAPAFAWGVAALVALAAVAAGGWTASRLAAVVRPRTFALLLLLAAGGSAVVMPALLGSRMEIRFATNREDVEGRSHHWKTALDIMQPDWATHALGMGTGRFPEEYLFARSSAHGNYGFRREDQKTVLLLGGGQDLTFGQRIRLPAWQPYTLTLHARTADARADLRVRICRRHILVPFDWNPQCVTMQKTLQHSQAWQEIVWDFDIGALGDGTVFGRRPLLLEIMNSQYRADGRPGTRIEIADIGIRDRLGRERVDNGNFARALERWFPYYDFEHLPWHIKNLWVNLYFDQGWLGLLGFIAFLFAAAQAAVRHACDGGLFGVALFAILASYMAVGMVGGLIDVPRVVFLFYLLGMGGMLLANAQAGKPGARRTRRHAPRDSISARADGTQAPVPPQNS